MHFYTATDKGVEPRHFVPMASRPNELRPSRMSDLRAAAKRGEVWAPSVTTVMNVLSKPGLVKWQIDMHLEQAHQFIVDDPKWMSQTAEEFAQDVRRLTELEMAKAPDAGTDIHKSLEDYVSGALKIGHQDFCLCQDVFEVIADTTGCVTADFKSEANFVHPLGFGGQVDLHNQQWVIDFKSKQTADKFKPGKMAYDEHRMQLAAYRVGLGLDAAFPRKAARCANVFICLETGEVDFHEHTPEELDKGWAMFQHCLAIWKLQNGAAQ